MTRRVFEIIEVENGDVLATYVDRGEAYDAIRSYILDHRASHPGIEGEVALIEVSGSRRVTLVSVADTPEGDE